MRRSTHAVFIALLAVSLPAAAQRYGGYGGRPGRGGFPDLQMPPTPSSQKPVTMKAGPLLLHATTRVVEIQVSAQNAQGQAVNNLTPKDFTIKDNGKPRPFTIFSFNSGLGSAALAAHVATPATAGAVFSNENQPPPPQQHSAVILLDAFNNWFEGFVAGRKAVDGMLNQIPPDERIAVYVISRYNGLQLLSDYTTNRARIRQVIDHYIPQGTCAAPGGDGSPPPATPDMSYNARLGPPLIPQAVTDTSSADAEMLAINAANTSSPCVDAGGEAGLRQEQIVQAAYDSVSSAMMALADNLRSQPGRKTVFWVSEGIPPTALNETSLHNNSDTTKKMFDALNGANVALDTLDTQGLDGPEKMWPGGQVALEKLADATGGVAYEHRGDLAGALVEGVRASRASYTLGFYLTKLDGKYHKLSIKVDRPGVRLEYRQGYYAQDQAQEFASQKKTSLTTALLTPTDNPAVGISAKLAYAPGKPEGKLDVQLNLDPATLSVTPSGGQWNGEVEEMFYEFNAEGKQVGRDSVRKRIEMTDLGRQQVSREGLNLPETLKLPATATRLNIIVRDTATGRIGTLTIPLHPPSAAASK